MSSKKPKATRKRMISCFAQIVQEHIPGWKIEEIVDVSKIYAAELSRVRGITPANLNTFSNANRTRDPKVMQTFFWTVYDIFRNEEPDFIKGRHHGRLSKFRLRGIASGMPYLPGFEKMFLRGYRVCPFNFPYIIKNHYPAATLGIPHIKESSPSRR